MARRIARKSRKPRTVYFRRKREGKTNYKKRLGLLKSGRARLVVRRTNKHTIMQLVTFDVKGDVTSTYATSKDLEKFGWKHSGKSLPGAYLTGLLLANKAGVKEAVLDFGLRRPAKGGRIFAAIKGSIDGGMNVKAEEGVFPSGERLNGNHISESIAKDVEAVKTKIQA